MRIEITPNPTFLPANQSNLAPGDVFIVEGGCPYLILQSCRAVNLSTNEIITVGQITGRGRRAVRAALNVEL